MEEKREGEMKREAMRKELVDLEAKVRNRLVLPKTILSEMQKLSGKTENALMSIEGLVEDVKEVRRRFEEKGGGDDHEA